MIEEFDYKKIAKEIFDDIQKVQLKNVPNLRRIRQRIMNNGDVIPLFTFGESKVRR